MLFSRLRKKKQIRHDQKEVPALAPDADTVTTEPEQPAALERLKDPAELARRVNLILTTFYPGEEPDNVAESVLDDIAAAGCHLSNEEWNAILRGAPGSCDDEQTLSTLGSVLGLTMPYLTHTNTKRDEITEAQLELAAAFRDAGTTSFRACGPGGTFVPTTAEDFRFIAKTVRESQASSEESGCEPLLAS